MSVAFVPRTSGTHRAGFLVVVGLHALIGLALLQGLARTVIEGFKPPPVTLVKPPDKPVVEPPTILPIPKSPLRPPLSTPQPPDERDFRQAEPTITSSQEPAPPAGSPTGDPAAATAAPLQASPHAVAPRPAARPTIGNVQACAPTGDDYPMAARRSEISGTTRLRFTVSAVGALVGSQVVRSAGPTREHKQLDRVAESKLAGCTFSPGIDQNGHAIGGTFEVDYVWKLEF